MPYKLTPKCLKVLQTCCKLDKSSEGKHGGGLTSVNNRAVATEVILVETTHAGFPHFFICIFQGLFQDFSRSKLSFSRTVICDKKNAAVAFMIIYLFKKNTQL